MSYPGPGGPGSRLDLCYVAERMLALHLPDRDAQAEAQAAHMLNNKHGEHYMVSIIYYTCKHNTPQIKMTK